MNIGVMSDSHGDTESLRALLGEMGQLDALCFLGDVSDDAQFLETLIAQRGGHTALYAVRGNNDFAPFEPEEMTVTLAGKRLLLVHGHRLGVKQGLLRLALYARQKGADVALFGHTHETTVEADNGVLLLNPGAAGRGFFASRQPCAAVLKIDEQGGMQVRAVTL